MSKIKDLSGNTYNDVFVIGFVNMSKSRKARFKCKCHCGNEFITVGSKIKSGHTKSCGCLNINRKARIDIIGREFNGCVVLSDEGHTDNKVKKRKYKCKCFCGNDFVTTGEQIRNKAVKSCGCINKARGSDHFNFKEGSKSRDVAEYRMWRLEVYTRDSFKCECCKDSIGGNLEAHHLKSFTRFPELKYDLDNGITLCKSCHRDFHMEYGTKSFTSDDFYEFLKERWGQYGGK